MLLHHSLSHAYEHRQFISGSCYCRPCAVSPQLLSGDTDTEYRPAPSMLRGFFDE